MSARDDDTTLAADVVRLKAALLTLIAWLPQSSPAPISRDEAARLIKILQTASVPAITGRYLQRFPPEEPKP